LSSAGSGEPFAGDFSSSAGPGGPSAGSGESSAGLSELRAMILPGEKEKSA
jgi:hypothetical protein